MFNGTFRAQHQHHLLAMGLVQTDALFKGNAEHGKDLRGIGSPGLVKVPFYMGFSEKRKI